jgi:hypothetical protein
VGTIVALCGITDQAHSKFHCQGAAIPELATWLPKAIGWQTFAFGAFAGGYYFIFMPGIS